MLTVWDTGEAIRVRPMDPDDSNAMNNISVPGYVRIHDPTYAGAGVMDGFSNIEAVSGCEPTTPPTFTPFPTNTPVPPPTFAPPPTIPPTAFPTPLPPLPTQPAAPQDINLVVTGFRIEPESPVAFEKVKIILTIENQGGTPYAEPYWDYNGQVSLKAPIDGLLEEHIFSKNDSSTISIHSTTMPLIWEVTITTYFWHWGQDGEVEIFIQPSDPTVKPFTTVHRVSIRANNTEISKCGAFVARKLASTLPTGNQKAFLDGIAAGGSLFTCSDVSCIASMLGKLLLKYISDAGRIIMSLASIFDLDGAQECAIRWVWAQELVSEFTRQGVYINMLSVHSPAVIMASDPNGNQTGFLTDGSILENIPNARAVADGDSKLILLPTDITVRTSLTGIGDGTMTVTTVNNGVGHGQETQYIGVPVHSGLTAYLDPSDTTFAMQLDTNGDGVADQSRAPDQVNTISSTTGQQSTKIQFSPICFFILGFGCLCVLGVASIALVAGVLRARRRSRNQ
jgi:hypothetical protein